MLLSPGLSLGLSLALCLVALLGQFAKLLPNHRTTLLTLTLITSNSAGNLAPGWVCWPKAIFELLCRLPLPKPDNAF